jgi:hypothetical protein
VSSLPFVGHRTLLIRHHRTVVAAFDPRIEGQALTVGCVHCILTSKLWWFADVPGAYLVDCVEDNAAVAPHSADPVCRVRLSATVLIILF